MNIKPILNQLFYKGLCALLRLRIKYQEYQVRKQKKLPAQSRRLLLLTCRPHASLKPAIQEILQSQGQTCETIVIKQIAPAIPLTTKTNWFDKSLKRFRYLWQQYRLAFFIIGNIHHHEGVILETFFSYKGVLSLEELFLGCFQKTVLDATQIRQTFQYLQNNPQYDLDPAALEKKMDILGKHVALYWNDP